MISSFLLVPARVPGLVSLFFLSFLSQEEECVPSWFSGSFWFRARVPGLVSLLFFRFFSQEWDAQWILYCAWTSWKHGLLLFGVFAGVFIFIFVFLVWEFFYFPLTRPFPICLSKFKTPYLRYFNQCVDMPLTLLRVVSWIVNASLLTEHTSIPLLVKWSYVSNILKLWYCKSNSLI